MSLLFSSSQVRKSVKGVALQDPKVHRARLPEDLFGAQKQGPSPWLLLFVCGSSPAWFVSDSLGLMKFYTVCMHQPLIFEWVKANLFICHLLSLPKMLIFDRANSRMVPYFWELLNIQYYVQFLQQIKNPEQKFMCCRDCKLFLFAWAFGNRRFLSPCTSDFTWILLFMKDGHTVVSFSDGWKDDCPCRLYKPDFWLVWEYFLRRLIPVLPCLFFSFLLYYAWCSADLSLEQVTCQLLEKGDLLVTDITKSPWKIKRILFFLLFFYLALFSLSSCKLVW